MPLVCIPIEIFLSRCRVCFCFASLPVTSMHTLDLSGPASGVRNAALISYNMRTYDEHEPIDAEASSPQRVLLLAAESSLEWLFCSPHPSSAVRCRTFTQTAMCQCADSIIVADPSSTLAANPRRKIKRHTV